MGAYRLVQLFEVGSRVVPPGQVVVEGPKLFVPFCFGRLQLHVQLAFLLDFLRRGLAACVAVKRDVGREEVVAVQPP